MSSACRKRAAQEPAWWCFQRCGTAPTPMIPSQAMLRTSMAAPPRVQPPWQKQPSSTESLSWGGPYRSAARGSCTTPAWSTARRASSSQSTGRQVRRSTESWLDWSEPMTWAHPSKANLSYRHATSCFYSPGAVFVQATPYDNCRPWQFPRSFAHQQSASRAKSELIPF